MLILKENHPAWTELKKFTHVVEPRKARKEVIRPIRLGILNLMPLMMETENHILRCLSHSPLQIEPIWLTTITRKKQGRHTSLDHVRNFYTTLEKATESLPLDGLIVTGSPIEHLDFHKVAYWDEIRKILDYAEYYIHSTLCLCWAAMAAAYHFWGIQKTVYKQKLAGIFSMINLQEDNHRLTYGLDPIVTICQSRHTDWNQESVLQETQKKNIIPLFSSEEKPRALEGMPIGITAFSTTTSNIVCNLGHLEYQASTIDHEVKRDKRKEPPILYPVEHYYSDELHQTGLPSMSWKASGTLFFTNFIHIIYDKIKTTHRKHKAFAL